MTSQPDRAPVYGPVHKVHRYALSAALQQLGATDFANPAEATTAVAVVRQQLAFSAEHLHHEDRHVHPMVRTIGNKQFLELEAAHGDHRREFDALGRLADRIEGADTAERVRLGSELYLAFARFMARDFEHMDFEERVIEPLLHARYSDEQITRLHLDVIAETPAEELEALGDLAAKALSKPEQEAVRLLFEGASAAA